MQYCMGLMWHQRSQHSPKLAGFAVPCMSWGTQATVTGALANNSPVAQVGKTWGPAHSPPQQWEGNKPGGCGGSHSFQMATGCRCCGFSPLPSLGTERAKAAAVHPCPCGNGTGAASTSRKRHFAAQPASLTRLCFLICRGLCSDPRRHAAQPVSLLPEKSRAAACRTLLAPVTVCRGALFPTPCSHPPAPAERKWLLLYQTSSAELGKIYIIP